MLDGAVVAESPMTFRFNVFPQYKINPDHYPEPVGAIYFSVLRSFQGKFSYQGQLGATSIILAYFLPGFAFYQ